MPDLPGFGETAGQALGRHLDVDLVAFTGSTEVGKLFLRYSGESNMKRLALECGGKSPHVVFSDCGDLDAAAQAAAWGVFYNAGEVCNAGSRLLVHADVKDALVERIVNRARTIKIGNPLEPDTEMGPMATDKQYDTVLSHFESARAEGATIACGGNPVASAISTTSSSRNALSSSATRSASSRVGMGSHATFSTGICFSSAMFTSRQRCCRP